MKKRNFVLQAAVASALLSVVGIAQAGTIVAGNVNYATEAIGTATTVTLGNVVYTLGVARTTTQPFTILYTLNGTAQFNATPAVPTASGGTCAVTPTLKRGGGNTNQVVYDVVVTGNCAAGDMLTLPVPVIKSSGLGTAGNTVGISVQLLDTGETACVDNVGTPATCIVGPSTRATGADVAAFNTPFVADTLTVINAATVAPVSPLTNFVVANGDTATIADVSFRVNNQLMGVFAPDGVTPFTLAAGDIITLTVTDPTGFLGLATNGLCYDFVTTGNGCDAMAAESFTITGNTATRAIPGNNANLNVSRQLFYTANGSTPLGTSRTFQLAGSVAPVTVGAVTHALAGAPANFWQWGSNGTVLQSPFFSTSPGYLSRFALTNTGTTPLNYTAIALISQAQDGSTSTCTLGTGRAGSIPAGTQLIVEAGESATALCASFSGAKRAAAVFTVNGSSNFINGQYIVTAPNGSVTIGAMQKN